MFDFSNDEFVFLIAALAGTCYGTWRWYYPLLSVSPLNADSRSRKLLVLTPPLCLALLMLVLQGLADPVYVAGHLDYTLLFLAGGACWIFGASAAFSLIGVSTQDDAMRRRNPAAAICVAGGTLGVTLAYSGSNIGNGPTIWTTLVPALISTSTLLILWFILEVIGGCRDAITLDRDDASGIRAAAFLACAGAVLGRAMAGDWLDWSNTLSDFVQLSWPAALLIPLMTGMNRTYAPTPEQPNPESVKNGWLPALLMLGLTAAYLTYLGLPEVAPAPRP